MLHAILFAAYSYASETKIKSKIDYVTVFQNGAQINRSSNVFLKSGRTELVFSQLEMTINPQTIQASGKGDFTILGVVHRYNYLEKIELDKRIREMQDSIQLLSKKIEYLRKDINVFNEESALIKANKNIGGQQTGVKVSELEAAANFYRKRLQEIFTLTLDINYKIQDYNEIKTRIQNQLNTISKTRTESVSEIVVEVLADKAGNTSVELSYIVNNARWVPEYDIRATDIDKPIELHSRALIYQNTGVDWENVKLIISTGNPNQNGIIPTLYTWYLNYRTANQYSNKLEQRVESNRGYLSDALGVKEDAVVMKSLSGESNRASNTSNFTQVVQSQTQTKYEIEIPYNIPSSTKETQVKIQKYQLNATYRYYSVPKLDLDVFLQARITGWEALNIVPGNVNVFFEGTYITKAYLNPQNFTDTLDISLGRDKSIVIKREIIKDKNGTAFIGGKKRIKKAYSITVRNTKSTEILIVIEDHIPLSRNKEIEVELIDKDGAKYDLITGKLTWEMQLKPRTTVKKDLSYEVKYPKDIYIINLE